MSEYRHHGFVPFSLDSKFSTHGVSVKEHIPAAPLNSGTDARGSARRADCSGVVDEPQRVIRGETSHRSQTAHIDWLAFTFRLPDESGHPVAWLLSQLFKVFSLPAVPAQPTGKGWNGYAKRVNLGEDGQYGLIAYGGEKQRDTVHVELSATACAHISDWCSVQRWGETLNARITRVDLAHDDFAGDTVSIEKARAWYDAGEFTSNGRPPAAKLIDDLGTGKGKTLYVGNRANGKLLRVYEKGCQLGDASSPWVRVELELRGKGRIIPWDVLTSPATYLAGGYPCLAFLATVQDKIRTITKVVQVSIEAGKHYLRTAGGKWLNVLMQAYQGDACAVILALVRPGIPRRLENYGDFLPKVFEAGHALDAR